MPICPISLYCSLFFSGEGNFQAKLKTHTTNSFGVDFCHFCVVFCHFCVILASCFLSRICCMFLRHVFWRDGNKYIVSGSRYIYIYLHLPTVQNFCLFMHKTQPKGRNSAQLEDLGINSFGVPFDLCSFPLNNLLMSRMSFVHVFDYN